MEKIHNIHNGIIYPRFYRYRRGQSDRDWIFSRMAVIPKNKQKEIADEYERIYLSGDRQARNRANTWLNGIAKEYKNNGA